MYGGTPWSRDEDKLFEKALLQFPDGVHDRWPMIAGFLPGKSPDEVREHYEDLLFDVAEIESGRVELPCYSDETASFGRSRVLTRISAGSLSGNRSRHSEVERKKGTPWTEHEHGLFLIGLDRYGKGDWRSISRNVVVTRTPTQVASHAQKYFLRRTSTKRERRRSSIHDITTANGKFLQSPTNFPRQGSFPDYGYPMPR